MVATTLPPLCFHTTKVAVRYSTESKKNEKQKQIRLNKNKNNNASAVSFLKPSPTPLLLIKQKPSQTKLEALDVVVKDIEASVDNGIDVDVEIFSSLLETCYRLQAIQYGVRIHRLIPANLLRKNVGLSSKLVRLYAACGYVDKAHEVFDQMSKRDSSAFAWNSLISGHAELGLYEDALALYFQMEEEGVEPDRYTFPRVLKACAGVGFIQIGVAVHRHIVRSGFLDDGFVLNALVDMYAKCGDIVKARKVFDKIASPDLVSWNSMLTGYTRHGLVLEALDLFCQMLQQGYQPDSIAISAILSGVTSLKLGVQIHGWAVRHGVEWNLSIANSLIVMYSCHGKLVQARWLFENMPERDIVSWNSIISAHSKEPEALIFFEQMEKAGVLPDNITFVSLLSACAHLGLVKEGERLFSIMRNRYGMSSIMEHYGCMVNLYGRAGLIEEAYHLIVEGMEIEAGPTVWGALLYACCLHGNVEVGEVAAERLFELEPDNEHNYELLMKIYGNAGRVEDVKTVKMMMVDRGLDLYTNM
ncbi:pentatricopeptide repeat-containing protein At4g25270, chloroplastic [Ziziphus jujuba]|uniref:Pentatricopeptide repeat-containing protein At4g25270, chloroplastic n=1 Tax=Ziziphus jujuba TaxID=326968 RepID=A0A6P6G1D7_ZIZJJ|nr:pentatricopeptide repeat-containing protein At4g25270, chloroplastic [Ziziphus jujuba]